MLALSSLVLDSFTSLPSIHLKSVTLSAMLSFDSNGSINIYQIKVMTTGRYVESGSRDLSRESKFTSVTLPRQIHFGYPTFRPTQFVTRLIPNTCDKESYDPLNTSRCHSEILSTKLIGQRVSVRLGREYLKRSSSSKNSLSFFSLRVRLIF